MILDSSVLVPLLLAHEGHERILVALVAAPSLGVGAPTLTETSMVLAARLSLDPTERVRRFVEELGVEVVAFTDMHWREAAAAAWRYGKGRHPAGLNFGDCLAYATARMAGEPLCCVGDDFTRTDLEVVLVLGR